MRKDLHQYLADILDIARSKEQRYRPPRGIFDDLHDFVGVRIVVDYPSGLKESIR